jgi:hypothetical protein
MDRELSFTWLFEHVALSPDDQSEVTEVFKVEESGFEQLAILCFSSESVSVSAHHIANKLPNVAQPVLKQIVEIVRRGVSLHYSAAVFLACGLYRQYTAKN